MCKFNYNDGGRSKYFKGRDAGDCVTRAITIATEQDYKEVYNDMALGMKKLKGKKTARDGVSKKVYHSYLIKNGFEWVPTMTIGSGCKVHLCASELPEGTLVVRVSKHLTCVMNGVIHDTYNPQRGSLVGMQDGIPFKQEETRCVYGYYIKK